MVTLKEIAVKVGVSKSTVSRVINNTGLVNKETEAKVHKAIEELKYRPNQVARTLSSNKSNVIGMIVPKTSHNFFALLVERVDYYLGREGFTLMLGNVQYDLDTEQKYLDLLNRYFVDGVIIASHTLNLEDFENVHFPIVTFDRIISNKVPYVESDNYEGGKLATEHLIEKGCRNLVHIAGAKKLDSPANKRGEAFKDVCRKHGVAHHIEYMGYTKFGFQDNFKLLEELYTKYPDVDGIFASNDALGISAIKIAQKMGRRVPEDIQVIGYDDVEIAQLSNPELTTIRQSIDTIAQELVANIIDQVRGRKAVRHTIVPVELIKRGSTL